MVGCFTQIFPYLTDSSLLKSLNPRGTEKFWCNAGHIYQLGLFNIVDKIGEIKGGKLVRRDKTTFAILPLEPKKPPKIPPRAILKCPICGTYSMKQIADGLWQCTNNPFHTISIIEWFPRRR